MSTNTRFYGDLMPEIPDNLPVWEGEVPGQDYPVGAMSTAVATAVNRRNHVNLPVAEILASEASLQTDYEYQPGTINDALEDILWHDEHAWGHHFPAGPTARASFFEKSLHAYRAEAFLHDVISKSTARIADAIRPPKDASALRLVVFNPFPQQRTGAVRAPLREIDNCGSTITDTVDAATGTPVRRGVLLTDRWHVNPDSAIIDGKFRLVEEESGAEVDFQIERIDGAMDALPFAPERTGLGSGTQRYGFYEDPAGLSRDIVFLARDIPSCGYRSYLLIPQTIPAPAPSISTSSATIENEFFKIRIDGDNQYASIIDKENGRELVDRSCPHRFLEVLIRQPDGSLDAGTWQIRETRSTTGSAGSSLCIDASVSAHPAIRYRIDLVNGDPDIHVSVRVLKSSEPLLDVFLCFPFFEEIAKVGYEGTLCSLEPGKNLLPGAYSDELTVQNWVSVRSASRVLLWASFDAPLVSLSELWPGYTSPAHRAVLHPGMAHPQATAEDFTKGWIFSRLFGNNFGTNFYVSQSGDALFRYTFRTDVPENSTMNALGASMVTPFETIFGATDRDGDLPASGGAMSWDDPELVLLNWKHAETNKGYVLRMWNPKPEPATALLTFHGFTVDRAWYADPREIPLAAEAEIVRNGVSIDIGPASFVTIYIPGDGMIAST